MAVRQSPDPDLSARVARCRNALVRRSLTIYRSCSPKYATEQDLVTGQGSRLYGGRWNPIGIAAVYGSATPETALAESLANVRHYGLDLTEAMPRVFVAIQVHLNQALDLTSGTVRRRIRVARARMLADDWRDFQAARRDSLCQAIGRAAHSAGFDGLLVPSAADPRGTNVIAFPDNLASGTDLAVMNANELQIGRGRKRH